MILVTGATIVTGTIMDIVVLGIVSVNCRRAGETALITA